MMTPKLKNLAFRAFDLATFPLTYVSAVHLWLLRRYGIPNFPLARAELLRRGVFPLRRHFYEPQFHPDDLPESFADERSLPGIDLDLDAQCGVLEQFRWQAEVTRFTDKTAPVLEDGTAFDLDNGQFPPGDVDFYYQIIRLLKPRRIIEIGSGHSTIVAISALEQCEREDRNYQCDISAIEPFPWFRHPRLRLIEERVEQVALNEFSALGAGDILFIDSSHMLRPGGDVEHEYLRVLPTIASGVYIHIHDIFTPFHYPEAWVKSLHKFWNEQYVLEAVLGGGGYRIVAALRYLARRHPAKVKKAMPLLQLRDRLPASFWIKKTGQAGELDAPV
jgi:hypothetical protein